MKMSQQKRMRNKSHGWAAFDLEQKQGLKFEVENEPYPPISSSSSSSSVSPLLGQNLLKNDTLLVRPFSSVLPFVNFPTLTTVNMDFQKPSQFSNCGANQSSSSKLIEEKNEANNVVETYEQLKRLHSWADKSLIEDIMAAVSNNFDEGSTLLKAMVSDVVDRNSNNDEGVSLGGDSKDVQGLGFVFENDNNVLIDEHSSSGERLHEDGGHMEQILGDLRFIPMEPEWEEDDIYLIQRKDAVKMMRSASRHSKAANDAYLRGDHLSAQQFSVKAKEEWKAAERLNAKAAKEILSIRNGKNDIWTLDLHGLHAAEAVQALQEHLKKVEESQGALNRSSSPSNNNILVNSKGGTVRSAASIIDSSNHIDKLGKQQALSRQRPTSLQVITGKGNHSRGQASLPVAIERFLSKNRYHYDERRPGVIVVRPKFRQPVS